MWIFGRRFYRKSCTSYPGTPNFFAVLELFSHPDSLPSCCCADLGQTSCLLLSYFCLHDLRSTHLFDLNKYDAL